jgi:hypothetical protein
MPRHLPVHQQSPDRITLDNRLFYLPGPTSLLKSSPIDVPEALIARNFPALSRDRE